MDLPLDYGVQGSVLPKELLITVGAPHDEARDTLRRACRFMNQKLSIKGPYLEGLIAHPLFHTNSKNIQWLAFNAAWDGKIDLLKNVMKHMVQQDYRHHYELAKEWVCHFDLIRVVEMKMPDKYDEVEETAKCYSCSLDRYYHNNACDELKMACYNKDAQLLQMLIKKNGISYDFENLLYLAIDKNSAECIHVILSYIKSNILKNHQPSIANCKTYQDILEVAMENQKDKAFGAIVHNDIFGCLNFTYGLADGRRFSMLDWIIEYVNRIDLPNKDKYIKTYRKCGGETCAELSNKYCLIQ